MRQSGLLSMGRIQLGRTKRARTCVTLVFYHRYGCKHLRSPNLRGRIRCHVVSLRGDEIDQSLTRQAADYHEEDHPEITAYLRTLGQLAGSGPQSGELDEAASRVDAYTSSQADALIEETQRVMAEAAARGEDPEAALREIVERAVREGLDFGGQLGDMLAEGDGRKKSRRDEEDEA